MRFVCTRDLSGDGVGLLLAEDVSTEPSRSHRRGHGDGQDVVDLDKGLEASGGLENEIKGINKPF